MFCIGIEFPDYGATIETKLTIIEGNSIQGILI